MFFILNISLVNNEYYILFSPTIHPFVFLKAFPLVYIDVIMDIFKCFFFFSFSFFLLSTFFFETESPVVHADLGFLGGWG